MTSNTNANTTPTSNGLIQDAQDPQWERLSPAMEVTTEEIQNSTKKRSKCHGNRKLQHFKRKCRARGLNEEEITTLISTRNHTISEQVLNDPTTDKQEAKPSNKRKRDRSTQDLLTNSMKSMSQLSISQGTPKKAKNSTPQTILSFENYSNHSEQDDCVPYKPSKYLKMPRKLLLRSLRLQLNYALKKGKEQRFILSRLQILDQQFCLDQIRWLYQTYFDIGEKFQIWPDDILKMIESNEYSVIQKDLEDYVILVRHKIDEFTIQLITQASSCPFKLTDLEMIDKRLKEFVHLHHLDLLRTVKYRVNKLKDNIQEKQLYKQLSYYYLSKEQFELIDHLKNTRREQLQVFKDLTMFEQRILCHRLPKSLDDVKVDVEQEHCAKKRNKIIQELKRRMLNEELEKYENKIQYYEHLYQQDLAVLEIEISNPTSSDHKRQVATLTHFIKQYFSHYTDRFLRQIRYQESWLHAKLLRHYRRHSLSSSTKNTTDVYPQIIIDVPNVPLNHTQLEYLSRNGPNYIRPNQTYLHSNRFQEKQMTQQYKKMMDVIITYLIRVHHIPQISTIIEKFAQNLGTCQYQRYLAPLSYLNIYRALRELKLVKSIQHRLKKGNYVLRVTDKSGIFHIGHRKDYEEKAEAYRQKTNAYMELPTNPLWTIFDKVVHLLNDLRSKKHILAWQLDKMMPKREKVELAYLYFIPKPHKEGTPLRPIVSSMNTPTTAISKLLDKLIRPIFDKHARSTTIIDGVDLIRRLEKYNTLGYLKPTTLLCTFDITDLYTMLPQEESLNVLMEFLSHHGYQKVKDVPIGAIRKLASIVLTENVFMYGNKFYRQILGGAMGSAFTLTLANIFMWKWEKQLVYRQIASNEIYGRYIDDIFFTSNESLETIHQMLNEANNFHPNIKLVRKIGTNVPFLDVFIENNNGVLTTSVYHKEAAEPYIVPFKSDHPRHVFRNIIETALLRAIRYSSTLPIFNKERRAIKLKLLYNGYPPRYIHAVFNGFFARQIPSMSLALASWIENESQFLPVRHKLLEKQTIGEQQLLYRIANIADNDKKAPANDKNIENKLQKQDKWNTCLIVHYKHEQRLAGYKKDLHQIWNTTFIHTPIYYTKLIVGTCNNPNNTRELVFKRPSTTSTTEKKTNK